MICLGLFGGCAEKSDDNTPQEGSISLTLTADRLVVGTGEPATLSWTASNAATCEASGGWSGPQATAGTFVTPTLNTRTTFALSCSGHSGNAVAQVTVDIHDPNQGAPNVVLTSSPASIPATGTATLRWSAVGANSCEASGAWSGAMAPSGTQLVGGLARDASFTLSCTGPGGTGIAMTQVVLQRATLRWETPRPQPAPRWLAFACNGARVQVYTARWLKYRTRMFAPT